MHKKGSMCQLISPLDKLQVPGWPESNLTEGDGLFGA